ncbi:translation initiation factor 4E [Nematocida minor]|uniref:translation initiation factor 4E n=1 Tax=Nematocida minor TaxID=1912983 RepID=UPI00221F3B7D|nr:translation initiation factor 4E [Nematocida minor]KAI5189908.1 translation initiation factor 4E [Nematocida minor]
MSMEVETKTPRHRLNENWTFWYDFQEKKYVNADNWSDNLQKLGVAPDVETFWSIVKEVGDVSSLPISSNIHFFRNGIAPMWEDKRNANGGKWVLELPAGVPSSQIWLNTLLFCISESVIVRSSNGITKDFIISDATVDTSLNGVICGAVLSPRKNYTRISIWTSIKDRRVTRIGELWKSFSEISDSIKLNFKAHESAIKGSRDSSSDVYSL